jgi:hypothetical protein
VTADEIMGEIQEVDEPPENIPTRPNSLPEIAERLLTRIAQEPLSSEVVLGGGIALKHYADFRPTQDIDAWWRESRNSDSLDQIVKAVTEVASEQGLDLKQRRFGATDSLDLHVAGSAAKVFSFQIAVRDVQLEQPLESAWTPILIETLRENIGSKMNALVNRGAPRDFVDIFEVVQRGLLRVQDCWRLWQAKNPQADFATAYTNVVASLERIGQKRPIATLPDSERNAAERLRSWFRTEFDPGVEELRGNE